MYFHYLGIRYSWSPTPNSLTQTHLVPSGNNDFWPLIRLSVCGPCIGPCTAVYAYVKPCTRSKRGLAFPKICNSSLQSNYFVVVTHTHKHSQTPSYLGSKHSWLPWEIGFVFGRPAPIFEKNAIQSAQTAKTRCWGSNEGLLDSSWLVGFKNGPKSKMTIFLKKIRCFEVLCAEPICGLPVKIGNAYIWSYVCFHDLGRRHSWSPTSDLPRHTWFNSGDIDFWPLIRPRMWALYRPMYCCIRETPWTWLNGEGGG